MGTGINSRINEWGEHNYVHSKIAKKFFFSHFLPFDYCFENAQFAVQALSSMELPKPETSLVWVIRIYH